MNYKRETSKRFKDINLPKDFKWRELFSSLDTLQGVVYPETLTVSILKDILKEDGDYTPFWSQYKDLREDYEKAIKHLLKVMYFYGLYEITNTRDAIECDNYTK